MKKIMYQKNASYWKRQHRKAVGLLKELNHLVQWKDDWGYIADLNKRTKEALSNWRNL
jgi:retron-type reverse transcriptase